MHRPFGNLGVVLGGNESPKGQFFPKICHPNTLANRKLAACNQISQQHVKSCNVLSCQSEFQHMWHLWLHFTLTTHKTLSNHQDYKKAFKDCPNAFCIRAQVHKLGTGIIVKIMLVGSQRAGWVRSWTPAMWWSPQPHSLMKTSMNYYVVPRYLPDQTWHCHRALGLVI